MLPCFGNKKARLLLGFHADTPLVITHLGHL